MKTRIALLSVLAIALLVWYLRGAPNPLSLATQRLGSASAAALETTYRTEREWAMREIAADITAIAKYGGKAAEPAAVADSIAPWRPELLADYAAQQLGPAAGSAISEAAPADQHEQLIRFTPGAILEANAVVSAALKQDMRNPRAHESAALVLVTFGLRESAGRMSDERWAMNRATAHLAMARALRGGQPPASIDGQLAEIGLMAIANRHQSAIAALDAMPSGAEPAAAWQRALRMRVTQDWRLLQAPATASRLEQLEYFRARRATLRGVTAGSDLAEMRQPIAVDFGRIAQSYSLSVEDGNDFVSEGLTGELAELASVYQQLHERELPKQLPDAIVNARAGGLLAAGDPQVIPWAAWAQFAQRHIGQSIIEIDSHYRYMLGDFASADRMKADLDRQLGHLTLYAAASLRRNKGRNATEADLSLIDDAIDAGLEAPELLSFDAWYFMEFGAHYEPVTRTIPVPKTWFMPITADAPYDAGRRAEVLMAATTPEAINALVTEASGDLALLTRVLQRYQTNPLIADHVRGLLVARADYDLFAIDSAIGLATEAADRLALRKKACEVITTQCVQYGWELTTSDEAAAAAEFEKAFSDPALDQIAMAASSPWLVLYYERNGQPAKAADLAERAAATGSSIGLATLGRLWERRSRTDEAEELFTRIADRYGDKSEIAGFLYRHAVVAKQPEYLERWTQVQKEVFPNGLQPVPAAMPQRPANGVFVEKDTIWSRRVRLQAGDIIVGVDGWKVESYEQYDTIMSFVSTEEPHKYTAWRGVLFNVDLMARHGMTLKTHPLKGWIE